MRLFLILFVVLLSSCVVSKSKFEESQSENASLRLSNAYLNSYADELEESIDSLEKASQSYDEYVEELVPRVHNEGIEEGKNFWNTVIKKHKKWTNINGCITEFEINYSGLEYYNEFDKEFRLWYSSLEDLIDNFEGTLHLVKTQSLGTCQ